MKNNHIIILILVFQILCLNSYAVEPDEIFKNNEQETKARSIFKNIRCMVCQNQSIDDSSASLAKDLRVIIRNKIKNGESEKEIYKFLTTRYGDYILLKPPFNINTFALWLLPFIFFIFGIFFIIRHNKKFK
tara:strand:+ start:43 stop:438 length:396 start_codon:yes stop_codon:yes gene_type:complete